MNNEFSLITPFRFWCQKILPLVYDESLSYYEVLCKLVSKLNEISNVTNEVSAAVTELANYVNEYIDKNLDESVRNRLDEMFEDGSLGTLIINELYKNMVFPSMTDVVRNADNLKVDSLVTTIEYNEGSKYGGCTYKIKNGDIDSFGVYIGNGLVAVPIDEYVAPEEIGYVFNSNDDMSVYANKIINAQKNIMLKLPEYNSKTTIIFRHRFNTKLNSYKKTVINFLPENEIFLFDIQTGRGYSDTDPVSVEIFTTTTIENITVKSNGVGNFLKCLNKIGGNYFWGGKFILNNFNVSRVNKVFELVDCYNCSIANGIISNSRNTLFRKRNHDPNAGEQEVEEVVKTFNNCINFENVSFTNSWIEGTFRPDWAIENTHYPILRIENSRDISFNNCVFERRRPIDIINGEIVYRGNGYAIYSISPTNYLSFTNCWFEKLDYCSNHVRFPVNFKGCVTNDIKGFYSGDTGIIIEPNEIIGETTSPAPNITNILLDTSSLIFSYRYKHLSSEPANDVLLVKSNEIKTQLPINCKNYNIKNNSTITLNLLNEIGVLQDANVGRYMKVIVGSHSNTPNLTGMWEFDIVKIGLLYRASPLINLGTPTTGFTINRIITSGAQSARGILTITTLYNEVNQVVDDLSIAIFYMNMPINRIIPDS